MQVFGPIAEKYATFALEAHDSPTFAHWASRISGDAEVLAWLESLPESKSQPNLVFAAARWHGVDAPWTYDALRTALLNDGPDDGADDGPIRRTILSRSTQTNEVGRLTSLVPAFGIIEQSSGPLALVEVGASAGLCQFPDRWDYVWQGVRELRGSGGPTLECAALGPIPVPSRHPAIAHRTGVDLNPLDVTDADEMAWLEQLVWPEHDERRARLRRAVEVARQDPPTLLRGDLIEALPGLVEEAGRHGSPVVFHSAVIAYLPEQARSAYAELMADLVGNGRCHWVSNEGPRVLPGVVDDATVWPDKPEFALAIDGRQVAWAHPHGASLTWLPGQ